MITPEVHPRTHPRLMNGCGLTILVLRSWAFFTNAAF